MKVEIGKDYLVCKEADYYHFFEPGAIVRVANEFIPDEVYTCIGKSNEDGRLIDQVIKAEHLEEVPEVKE